jgi:hypothetical protein
MKKEFKIHRRVREENFKNSVGERMCKDVDSIKWLSIGQEVGCNKSVDKASGSIKFRRFPEYLSSY